MCNLYSLNKKRDMVARFFRVSHNRTAAFKPTGAIFARHIAPVVRCSDDGEREIVTMSWGFILVQNGRAPRPVTNVRDDKILSIRFWMRSFEERRCLVPATSFCEPQWRCETGDVPNVEIDTYSVPDHHAEFARGRILSAVVRVQATRANGILR